jgi:hypothetical protein
MNKFLNIESRALFNNANLYNQITTPRMKAQ